MEDSAKISARMEINMGKTVFMFPGQGAQYIGMAKDFYDAIPECREVFVRHPRRQDLISLRYALRKTTRSISRSIHRSVC